MFKITDFNNGKLIWLTIITFSLLVSLLPQNVIAQNSLNFANNYDKAKTQIKLIVMGSSNNTISTEEKSEYTSIQEIWNNPEKYQNQMVTLHGQYQGWHGEGIKHPLITRSDWVIKDDTGAIYVTGKTVLKLRPEKDIGIEIIVKGQVLLNKDMVPYIKATEVIQVNK